MCETCPACGAGRPAEWRPAEAGCWVRPCSACSCVEYRLGEGQRLLRCLPAPDLLEGEGLEDMEDEVAAARAEALAGVRQLGIMTDYRAESVRRLAEQALRDVLGAVWEERGR